MTDSGSRDPAANNVPLDMTPVRSRLQWALLHANRIDESVKQWASTALVIEQDVNPDTGRFIHRGHVDRSPPIDVSLALSDALHQTRSALDNLVGLLRGAATPASAYVIADSAEEFEDQARRRLEGVPDWAVDVIRFHQPFQEHGWKWVGDNLRRLHDLARLDRHRALLIQGGVIDLDQVRVESAAGGDTSFLARGGGSEMYIETRDANARPHFGATVLVREPMLKKPPWPYYPQALDLALELVSSANRVLMAVDQARPR
jgi:hypothetical protein